MIPFGHPFERAQLNRTKHNTYLVLVPPKSILQINKKILQETMREGLLTDGQVKKSWREKAGALQGQGGSIIWEKKKVRGESNRRFKTIHGQVAGESPISSRTCCPLPDKKPD